MLPVIALVGRPNVGKSTLFNRLTRSRDALVANFPGLTRDRNYGVGRLGSKSFVVIDTGGIGVAQEGLAALAAQQSLQAIEEADTVCLMVDARAGLTTADTLLATSLRRQGKVFHLVVNKIDGVGAELAAAEFHTLGVADLHPVSATHGHGVSSLLERLLQEFPEAGNEPPTARSNAIRVAIIGRPNVGKSTLVNRMLGEDRVLVYDQPGTTRDSIYIDFERRERRYTLIDTAGVRRHKNVRQTVEKFSIVKTLKAIDDAHVVILMMDAGEGVVEQDLHLLGLAMTAGRGVVIALNKWDGLDTQARRRIHSELERRLMFVDYADVRFISALHGTGVQRLYPSLHGAYDSATRKLSTNQLNRILGAAVSHHPPPLVNGRRIKLRYAHAGGQNPPLVIIHGNQTGRVPVAYQRYLEKVFRRDLALTGTPVRIEFRSAENPYADRPNKLNRRQLQSKRRMLQHVKRNRRG